MSRNMSTRLDAPDSGDPHFHADDRAARHSSGTAAASDVNHVVMARALEQLTSWMRRRTSPYHDTDGQPTPGTS